MSQDCTKVNLDRISARYVVTVISKKDVESPGDSHTVTIQWAHMRVDPFYVMINQRLKIELLSPMVVMLEGLGFNLCVAPFLNICVLNLPWRVGSGEC